MTRRDVSRVAAKIGRSRIKIGKTLDRCSRAQERQRASNDAKPGGGEMGNDFSLERHFWERPELCPRGVAGGGRTGFHPAHSRCLCPSASGAATSGGDFAAGQQLPAPGRFGDPCSSHSGSLGGSSASPYSSQWATAVDSDAGGCRGLRHFSTGGFGATATEDPRLGGEPAAALSPIMGGWLPVDRASGIMSFIGRSLLGRIPWGFPISRCCRIPRRSGYFC